MTSEPSNIEEQLLEDAAPSGEEREERDRTKHHLRDASIGAVGGGVVGALVGRAVGGKQGGMVGALAGAVAGGLVGDAVGEDFSDLEQRAAEALGEAPHEDELPAHYSWEQLQALSKPQ